MRVESALGALAAIESIKSLTLAATSSTSRGSPAASRVYGRLRMVTRTGCLSVLPLSIRRSFLLATIHSIDQSGPGVSRYAGEPVSARIGESAPLRKAAQPRRGQRQPVRAPLPSQRANGPPTERLVECAARDC